MIALLLSLATIVVLSLIGLAAQCVIYNTRSIGSHEILQSSCFGLCILSLLALNLSRAGLPVNSFADALVLFLVAASIAVLAWRRPKVYALGAFSAIALVACALLWVGRPLLAHGFDWIAFSNGDAFLYRNNAQRLLNHGFFELPKAESLVFDRDDSNFTFFFYALQGGFRPLFDLFLAVVGAVSRVEMVKAYMPVVAALFAIEAAAGVAFGLSVLPRTFERKKRVPTLLLCLTAIFAANSAIAVGGELGPQIVGVTLLASILAIPGLLHEKKSNETWLRWAFGSAILGSALIEGYAEMAPFLIGTFAVAMVLRIRLVIAVVRTRWQLVLKCLLLSGVTIVIALNAQLVGSLYLFAFVSGGTSTAAISSIQYPAYLIPSGPAVLWGLFSASASQVTGASDLLIAFGFVILAFYFISLVRISTSAPRLIGINFVLVALGYLLFTKRADFGLYKLAMYAQPFIWPVLIFGVVSLHRKWLRTACFILLSVVIAKSATTSKYYFDRSMDRLSDKRDDFVEVRRGTADDLLDQLTALAVMIDGRDVVYAASNSLVEKYVQDLIHARFLITPNFRTSGIAVRYIASLKVPFLAYLTRQAVPLSEKRSRYFTDHYFKLPIRGGFTTDVQEDDRPYSFPSHSKPVILIAGSDTTVVNLCALSSVSGKLGRQVYRDDEGANLLAQIGIPLPLEASKELMAGSPEFVGPDGFHGGLMFASPNILAYRILNPSPRVRLLFDYTATLNEYPFKKIPKIEIIGQQKVVLPTVGEGRARLLSDPLSPLREGRQEFLFIHIDQPLFRFRSRRKGLAALYGSDIQTDPRELVGFVREVSAIGADSKNGGCRSNPAPETFLSNVPFYSGVFEDGWLSPDVLLEAKSTVVSSLVISGSSPWLGGRFNVLTIKAGRFKRILKLHPGHSVIRVNITPSTTGPVLLHFDQAVGPLQTDQRRLAFLADHVELR